MVRGLKYEIFSFAINKPLSKFHDTPLEFFGKEYLMSQSSKRKVKVIGEPEVCQALWLGQRVPDFREVSHEGLGKIGQRRGANVVPNDE